jgi:hypothetical protein
MATSINGWPVLRPGNPNIKRFKVPGANRYLEVRGDVGPLLVALAAEYHKTIAPIDTGTFDDWSYAYREARFANQYSDHASATAIDLNATKEGRMGSGPYSWWKSNYRALKARRLKAKYKYVIWGGAESLGGDYRQMRYWDWMHWAFSPGSQSYQIHRQMNKLGIKPNGTTWAARPTVYVKNVQPDKSNNQCVIVKKALHKEFPNIKMDVTSPKFGAGAQTAWIAWERRLGWKTPNRNPDYDSLVRLGNKYGFKVAL